MTACCLDNPGAAPGWYVHTWHVMRASPTPALAALRASSWDHLGGTWLGEVSRYWSCHWYFDSYEHSRIPDQFHAGDPSVPNAMNPMQRETSKPYLTPTKPSTRRDSP
jgi:hypothetical protein